MARCKECGLEIVWEKKDGRWYGKNPDGSDHWDKCSEMKWKFLMSKKTRTVKNGNGDIYHIINGRKHYERKVVRTKAKSNLLSVCNCPVPPWEDCEHTNNT